MIHHVEGRKVKVQKARWRHSVGAGALRATPQWSARSATVISPVSTCTNASYFCTGDNNRLLRPPPRSRDLDKSVISTLLSQRHAPTPMLRNQRPKTGHDARTITRAALIPNHGHSLGAPVCRCVGTATSAGPGDGARRPHPSGEQRATTAAVACWSSGNRHRTISSRNL